MQVLEKLNRVERRGRLEGRGTSKEGKWVMMCALPVGQHPPGARRDNHHGALWPRGTEERVDLTSPESESVTATPASFSRSLSLLLSRPVPPAPVFFLLGLYLRKHVSLRSTCLCCPKKYETKMGTVAARAAMQRQRSSAVITQ